MKAFGDVNGVTFYNRGMYLLVFIVGATMVPMISPENQFFHSLQIRKWEDQAMFQGMRRHRRAVTRNYTKALQIQTLYIMKTD